MEIAEQRQKSMTLLCRRRHETIENMVFEFGVFVRTIRWDITAFCATPTWEGGMRDDRKRKEGNADTGG